MGEFVIITGLSGAGRTTAADTLDDLGWFVIDNMPPALIPRVAELANRPGSPDDHQGVALVVGRGGAATSGWVEELLAALDALRAHGNRVRVLFLEASDDVLVRRFDASRRRHPVDAEGLTHAIDQERAALRSLRAEADVIVDTSELNLHQLRDRLVGIFTAGGGSATGMQVSVISFGYKHGLPLDVDTVFDCRFLPNPHWVDELRPLTGLDDPVRTYVLSQPASVEFLARVDDLFALLLPAYVDEGKAYLGIAVGCTGGRHRSVAIAEELARRIEERGFSPIVTHRDVAR